MLTEPILFKKINLIEAPLDYKWNRTIEDKLRNGDNQRLEELLDKCNYKSVFGLGIAASEWVFWRFKQWRVELEGKNIDDLMLLVEALWIGLIDKNYLRNPEHDMDYIKGNKIESIVWYFLNQYISTRHYYRTSSVRLYLDVSHYIMIAQHISPDPKAFESWLTNCLKRMIELFPNEQIDEDGGIDRSYDVNQEPFIPREFYFDPEFDYETADLQKMSNILLTQADYINNPYLLSPEKVIEKGFIGTPYQPK
ncbi:hypothetical protein [Pragia fontium]|uniref:hypothetical protein n=1 Tax=Pragia fontium TaxID=82985 RepID=UPI000F711C74|nr:hypothetical protein [Pragia fontium]VEJ56329.1 Uncharacterised protein [Pragia fontium]